MTLRKGEISQVSLRREWPHQVALSADKVRGLDNGEIVYGFADTLSVGPRTLHVCRDNIEFVVFCFARLEDAETFCDRFGGEHLPGTWRP
jgi:hypothetical protein